MQISKIFNMLYGDDNKKIVGIIKKYFHLYSQIVEEKLLKEAALEAQYVSCTEIVPYDFFKDRCSICASKIRIKYFGNPILIFTDLKDSTKILKYFEDMDNVCLYIGYIYYSTAMLAEILDLIGGKIVEVTDDGTYSIILDENLDRLENFVKDIKNESIHTNKYISDYFDKSDSNEIFFLSEQCSLVEKLRCLIFVVFMMFNIAINKKLKENKYDAFFATRVGCVQGHCKITRIDIEGHLKVDKLIGRTV